MFKIMAAKAADGDTLEQTPVVSPLSYSLMFSHNPHPPIHRPSPPTIHVAQSHRKRHAFSSRNCRMQLFCRKNQSCTIAWTYKIATFEFPPRTIFIFLSSLYLFNLNFTPFP